MRVCCLDTAKENISKLRINENVVAYVDVRKCG